MDILVTGGAGVIGSHLTDRLLADGNSITVIDNLLTGKSEHIQHQLKNPDFKFVEGSILNEGLMEDLIQRVDMVYHLAASVGVKYIVKNPLPGILINIRGSEIVFELCHKYRRRVLFASSSEVYGKSKEIPFTEDGDRVLGSTAIPRWSYSTSKAADEHLALAYHTQAGLDVSIVRYFNSYGPRLDPKGYGSVVATFVRQCLKKEPITVHGTGTQTRCFTYVTDTIEGTILVGTRKEALGQAFNIGNPAKEISILQLAELVKKLTGSKSKIETIPYESVFGGEFEDTQRRVPSIEKASGMLGFKPMVDMEQGLKRTIEWARENYL